jgi:hypothetical protein
MTNEHQTNLELKANIYTKKQKDVIQKTIPEGNLIEKFLVEDTWDQSGRIRIREQKGLHRDEIKLTADIPLIKQDWREIIGVRFSAKTPETAENLRGLKELITEEPHLSYLRQVSAFQTVEGLAYLNKNLRVHKNGAEKNFYENPHYTKEGASWLSLIKDKKYLLKSHEDLELEIENEARIYIKPIEFDSNRPINNITDTYALDGRFRLREKNGSLRYSIKVPLFKKDTEKTKACIRLEWKPNEEKEYILREIRDKITALEGTRTLKKHGQKLLSPNTTENLWINKNDQGKYWLEFDTVDKIPVLPREVRPINYQKSELSLTN